MLRRFDEGGNWSGLGLRTVLAASTYWSSVSPCRAVTVEGLLRSAACACSMCRRDALKLPSCTGALQDLHVDQQGVPCMMATADRNQNSEQRPAALAMAHGSLACMQHLHFLPVSLLPPTNMVCHRQPHPR
jgi:hypothetical protein